MQAVRIVIAGGGTGGHCLPALSVIEELRTRSIHVEFLWIGARGSVEQQTAQRARVPFAPVATGKLRRYLDLQTVADSARVPLGVAQAWRAIRAYKPDVIFSTGGFVSVPSVIGGARIAPILTHEQTTTIGLATKINARFADVLALSYEATRPLAEGLKPRAVVTGNPVRTSLLAGVAGRGFERFGLDPDLPLLYVMGGARGASPINQRVEALLPDLLDHCQIIHQTGPAAANDDAARLRALRATWSESRQRRYHVVEFVGDELADIYAATSLVLARAGAGTIAELPLCGIPALFIPLPASAGGEQAVNARMLGDAGAAVVLSQADATPDRLKSELITLLTNPSRLVEMASRMRVVGKADAAARLADELLALAKR